MSYGRCGHRYQNQTNVTGPDCSFAGTDLAYETSHKIDYGLASFAKSHAGEQQRRSFDQARCYCLLFNAS